MIFLYASAPGSCSPGDIDIPALLLKAGDILKKYPHAPQAQDLLKLVEEFKKGLEKAPGNN